jgi:hypothetical protein
MAESGRRTSRRAFLTTSATLATAGAVAAASPARAATAPDIAPPGGAWPPGPGSLIRPQLPDSTLRRLLSEIDPDRMHDTIEALVSFGTRHTCRRKPTRLVASARP